MYLSRILKFTCISIIASTSLHALSLKESVSKVLDTNPEVIAEKSNQKAFRKYIDEREGNYLPRIDIDGRIETSNSQKEYDSTSTLSDGSDQEDGYNFGIALNQMLYDGDLTPSQIQEAKHNYSANNYRTKRNIENVVLETITAYNGLVQYNEVLNLTKEMIQTNEENLETAKEKESISGEILETYQVDSKLNFVKEKYLEEKDLKSSRTSTFKRYVGMEPDGKECRPSMDLSKVPTSLQKTVELAVLRNYEVLEQIERIKAQRAKIAQADAKFLPNLNLELKALTDSDLSLNEEGIENQVFGRINLAWNLYNGGADYAVSKQEELFLSEQKERLDAITKKVVEDVKVTHQRLMKNKDRIDVLKKYVTANENIVEVYKSEFEAGTRTFVDILDAQTVLYEANKSLVNREFELYSNYYSLLNSLSMLSDSINESEVQACSTTVNTTQIASTNDTSVEKMVEKKVEVSDELNTLLGDDTVSNETVETAVEEVVENNDTVNTESVVETSVAKLGDVIETTTSEEIISESTSFLDAPAKYYTINITTTKGLTKASKFVNDNSLDESAYTYEFGPGMKSAKVIYGVYPSVKEANAALKALPKAIKAGKPYIDNVNKHQKLYAKYH